jgi:hypothetical protein
VTVAVRTSLLLAAVVLAVFAGSVAPARAKSPWKLKAVKVGALTSSRQGPLPAPALQGRVSQSLSIESPELPESTYVVNVRLVNASSTSRTLRWDVSQDPFLLLPDGRKVAPKGHMLHGLAKDALAVRGVLEVDLPAKGSYDLHPVFVVAGIRAGTKLVFDGAEASVPRP